MVGPIYNTGKINHLAKHNFTDGYQAPKARQDQVELVGKFFKKEDQVIQHEEKQFEQTTVQTGMERKAEALQRREEYLKKQENIDKKLFLQETQILNGL